MFIEWKDDYSFGVEEIDNQHKKMFEIINTLHDYMLAGKSKNILSGIIKELKDYTVYHFSTEEKYFDMYDYPEKDNHKKEHNDFVGRVKEIEQEFEDGKIFISVKIMNFLKDWLRNHILGTDKKYAPFFKENGIK